MKYWQLSTRRMSRAVRKLEMDGVWHPFIASPHSWYRVWNKKTLQRVQFESEAEESLLQTSLDGLLPLKDSLHTSGFQEELVIRMADEAVAMQVEVLFSYPLAETKKMRAFERALKAMGLTGKMNDALFFVAAAIDGLNNANISKAQAELERARLQYQMLSVPTPE